MAVVALYAVFAKELRETLRDPNAFALSVLYPLLLYPALVWGFSAWTEYQDGQSAGQDAAIVVLGAASSEIADAMETADGVHVVAPAATREAAADALARG